MATTTQPVNINKALASGGLTVNSVPPKTTSSPTSDISGNALVPSAKPTVPTTPSKTTTTKTVSPTVITSKAATTNLNNIKTDVGNINTGITTHAATVADTAAADKAAADKATADKAASDKAASDKALADAKVAAINGGTSTTTAPTQSADEIKLAQTEQDYNDMANNVAVTIKNIQNGSIPLSPGEQAQVTGLQAQYQTLIDQQKLQNTSAVGAANTRGYQIGTGSEYDPTFQAKTISTIITAGLNKVADLNTKMASAVATLTQSLKNNDIKVIQDSYSVYQDAAKLRMTTIKDTIDRTTAAIKDARDFAQKQLEDTLASDKLTYQQKQDAIQNAFEQQKIDETQRHDMATELLTGGSGGGIPTGFPSVSLAGNGAPSAGDQANFLATLAKTSPELATLVKGIANYDINPSALPTRQYKGVGGLTQAQVLAYVMQYDPTFSQADYNVRQAYKKSLASNTAGSLGGAINSANKATNHLTAFVDDMGAIGNQAFSSENAIFNATFGQMNPQTRQSLVSAQTEGLGVADELAKFFKGTGVTDIQSITDWKNKLSTNASSADVKGLVQGAITLMAGQLETLAEQYQRTMGKPPDNLLIGDSARANLSNLKNQGYVVDIPGIYYTDVNAYMKNGGNQDALSKARQMLVDANDPYNPATPENILQLAQIMNP